MTRSAWLVRLVAVAVFPLTAGAAAATHPRVSHARICRTSAPSGACGPYTYKRITNSNGYNTYTDQDMWAANSATTQTLTSRGPGNWNIVSNARPAGYTGVQTYPNVQRTIAEAGYDIWLSHIPKRDSNEVMVWVDNVNRGTGGASRIGRATINRESFTVLQYGGPGGELIFSLNRNERTGTVDILRTLNWLVRHGYEPPTLDIGQIEFGWEICSETTPAPGKVHDLQVQHHRCA